MGKFKNKFLSVLKEQEVPAIDANPGDDKEALANTLDDPSTAGDLEDVQDNQPNTARELELLQDWISNMDEIVEYLNGGTDSVLGTLRTDNKIGTIFDGVSDATKSEILDVCERLASLNQIFKNLYLEKHK
tara:strand:- start:382 stop:774 length:393 start_codon:yes stop_codon:yes gene_type:complete